jgi:hypothetical protein
VVHGIAIAHVRLTFREASWGTALYPPANIVSTGIILAIITEIQAHLLLILPLEQEDNEDKQPTNVTDDVAVNVTANGLRVSLFPCVIDNPDNGAHITDDARGQTHTILHARLKLRIHSEDHIGDNGERNTESLDAFIPSLFLRPVKMSNNEVESGAGDGGNEEALSRAHRLVRLSTALR